MIIRFFGYPVLLSATSDYKSIRVSYTTLLSIIYGIKEMIFKYSQQGKVNAIIRKFPLIPNLQFLEMHGYEVVNFSVPSDGEHFLNPDTMAVEIKKSGVVCERQCWIMAIRQVQIEKNRTPSVKIDSNKDLPKGDKIDI